jgi:hypothetical protein
MGKSSRPDAGVPRRHRMRKAQRRESARAWIESGATVTMKSYVKRYGTDRYTAYEDLKAIGFPLTEADKRWAVRPVPVPRPKQPADPPWDWRFAGRLPLRTDRDRRRPPDQLHARPRVLPVGEDPGPLATVACPSVCGQAG